METTPRPEPSLKPHKLTYADLDRARRDFVASNDSIRQDDPNLPLTPDQVIGGLASANPDYARFIGERINEAQNDHDKMLIAEMANVIYFAMRDALDPNVKIETPAD